MSSAWWMTLGAVLGLLMAGGLIIWIGLHEEKRERSKASACPLCVQHAAEQRIRQLCEQGLDIMLSEMLREIGAGGFGRRPLPGEPAA